MSKIKNDKYYTPLELAKRLIQTTFFVLSAATITDIIEPSAGNGSFSNQIENCTAYDIEPENDNIIQADFLKEEIEYKKGRLVIGNPPFGNKGRKYIQFYIKSCKIGDYIAFILPISQFNNNDSFSQNYDLIYSEDLGIINYSDVGLHCCFNVYSRPLKEKKRKKYNSEYFKIYDHRHKDYFNLHFDFKIIQWGSNSGKIVYDGYEKTSFRIKVYNKNNVEYIKNKIKNHNFFENKKYITMETITTYEIYKLFENDEFLKNNTA